MAPPASKVVVALATKAPLWLMLPPLVSVRAPLLLNPLRSRLPLLLTLVAAVLPPTLKAPLALRLTVPAVRLMVPP